MNIWKVIFHDKPEDPYITALIVCDTYDDAVEYVVEDNDLNSPLRVRSVVKIGSTQESPEDTEAYELYRHEGNNVF